MLRNAPYLRRGALLIRGPQLEKKVGPGSAEQRDGRCTASGTRDLQRPTEIMRDLADHAAAERQHADHEDPALDHGHPLPEPGQILLHGDNHEGTDHRAEHGAKTSYPVY